MQASKRLFTLLWILAAFGIAASVWPQAAIFWWTALAALAVLALLDALLVFRKHSLTTSRALPDTLPLGVWRHANLHLTNASKRKAHFDVYDHYPTSLQTKGLPQTLTLEPGTHADIQYDIRSTEREELSFPHTHIRLTSPLGLWQRLIKLGDETRSKVYPNFAAVSKFILLAMDNRLSQMGILKKRRRGEGQDFHQLREYRKGDSLRQIDWKASSRTRKLISREYQDERDQQIIFLIDGGQRMLSKDGELSHFDHTLNASLLLAYVALRQGDAVGLGTFSGEQRWLPPIKGIGLINRLLNNIYDLQPSTQTPDYSQAAMELLKRQKKRSLIIIITNVRDEDTDDLLPALQLLRKRHLVLLASMQEEIVQKTLEKPIKNFDDALRTAATREYLSHREKAFDKVRASGILSLDVLPSELSVSLVNKYLEIKSSGQL
ncbi:MAG TPA: DUF58 domain-containing protein [Chromatiales bacterium]|nr:DUF58 domain-containing protein [Thiotrichales bacterium]HIP69281.1 DUF58 domain-containing protein [Chromatiales bacterium]